MLEEKLLPAGGERLDAPVPRARRGRLSPTVRARAIGTIAVTLFVIAWEGVVRLGQVNPLFTSSPTRIVSTFIRMLHEGVLGKDIRVSGTEFLIGYGLAVVVGILVGVAMGWYHDVAAALQPFVSALYSTPRIALVPLFIIWLGIGEMPKEVLILIGVAPIMAVTTVAALDEVPEDLRLCARTLGASPRYTMLRVQIRAALPGILTGMRIAMAGAWTSIVAAELIAATSGLGYLIMQAGDYLNTALVFSGIIMIAIIALVLDACLRGLLLLADPSRPR